MSTYSASGERILQVVDPKLLIRCAQAAKLANNCSTTLLLRRAQKCIHVYLQCHAIVELNLIISNLVALL